MIGKKLWETLEKKAVKAIETSTKFKFPRMEEIQMSEDLYSGKPLPRLKGRFSVPLPTMSGYVDALLAKTDDAGIVQYGSDDDADKKVVDLTNSVAKLELRRRDLRWASKNRNQKKLAAFSGIGTGEFYTESDPKYKNYYGIVDHYDLVFEPMGGADLENHLYCGRGGLFRSRHDLEENAKSGFYDQDRVDEFLATMAGDEKKRESFNDLGQFKMNRYRLLGLDPEGNDFVGEDVSPFFWLGITHKGKRYLLTLNYETGIAVRIVPISEYSKSGLWPWTTWQTHGDEFNLMSKAVCDDLRPVAIAIDILFNQALDNRQKLNFGMRAVDFNIFPNPEELEWRPDGIVEANPGVRGIGAGVYEFKTPEIQGSVDMISFMEAYTGRKVGITPSVEGSSGEDKVGIYYGDLQQSIDRLTLQNQEYYEYLSNIGLRMLWGMKEHLTTDDALDMLGIAGAEEDDLLERVKPNWDIVIIGNREAALRDKAKAESRDRSLTLVLENQVLASRLNPEWVLRQILTNGQWGESEIDVALDQLDTATASIVAEAETAVQDILAGKNPPLNRGANLAFMKHLSRVAQRTTFDAKNQKKDLAIFNKIMAYANKHVDIVMQNAIMDAQEIKMKRLVMQASMPPEEPAPAEVAAAAAKPAPSSAAPASPAADTPAV